MATVGARGEAFLLTPSGVEYPILFTNRALAEIEQRTGKAITFLVQQARDSAIGVGDVAVMLLVGLEQGRREAKLGGRPWTMESVFELMDSVGFLSVAGTMFEGLAAVLAYDPKGEEPSAESADRPLSGTGRDS